MALERLQKQIEDMLLVVNLRREKYEQAARACKNLLKPWPCNPQANIDEREHCFEEKTATIDPQEEEELKLVSTILSKAQRTRVKTLSKSQHLKQVDDVQNTLGISSDRQNNCESSTDQDIKTENIIETVLSGNEESDQLKIRSFVKLEKGKQLKRKEENILPKAASKNSTKLSASSRNGFVTNNNKARPGGTANMERSAHSADRSHSSKSDFFHRPSCQPRLGGSHSKVRPAHVTAPFRTDPCLHLPKRLNTRKGISSFGNIHKDDTSLHFGNSFQQKKILPPLNLDGPSVQVPYTSQKQPSSEENICFDIEATRDSSQKTTVKANAALELPVSTELGECPPLPNKLDGYDPGLDRRPAIGAEACMATSSNQNVKDDVHCFTLLKDGKVLRIPPKVQRSFAKNWQLRWKAQQQTAFKTKRERGKTSHNGTDFAIKLEQLFDTEADLLLVQEAMQCLSSHKYLAGLLGGLKLDDISASSDIKEILHGKIVAEFVLSAFASLSKEASFFGKASFPHVFSAPLPGMQESKLEVLQTHIIHDAATSMKYRTAKDMQLYHQQILQVQNLQFQKQLASLMTTDVLPWIELDHSVEELSSIFQGIYSLISGDFPALVQDEHV